MGTTLACVQIYLGDKQEIEVRTIVIETLRQRVLEGSFVETTEENDRDSDREVFVGSLGDKPWLTVFDTQGDLRELAQRVSAAIDGTTVFINLIDSDVIHLRRYCRGDIIDDYCNAPDAYDCYTFDPDWLSDWGEPDNEHLKTLTRGDLVKWQDLMIRGIDLDRLRRIWDSKPVFADDILWATVDALGMNAEEIWADFQEEMFTRLTFRLTKPRLYEIKAEGLPKLSLSSYSLLSEVYVGDQLELPMSIQNNGGTATGLDIVVWGDALDKGIVELTKTEIRTTAKLKDSEEADFSIHKLRELLD